MTQEVSLQTRITYSRQFSNLYQVIFGKVFDSKHIENVSHQLRRILNFFKSQQYKIPFKFNSVLYFLQYFSLMHTCVFRYSMRFYVNNNIKYKQKKMKKSFMSEKSFMNNSVICAFSHELSDKVCQKKVFSLVPACALIDQR